MADLIESCAEFSRWMGGGDKGEIRFMAGFISSLLGAVGLKKAVVSTSFYMYVHWCETNGILIVAGYIVTVILEFARGDSASTLP